MNYDKIHPMNKLVLASNSPRRHTLLALTGVSFKVHPAEVNEKQKLGEIPQDYVRRLAYQKVRACAFEEQGLLFGADTIVVDNGELLGKPQSEDEARQMLQCLRGRTHQVYTGIALLDTDKHQTYDAVCCTQVPMRNYTDAEINTYIASGDPMDKAGSYGIQHPGFHPVEGLQGCYASVMGLPLCHLLVGMKTYALQLPADLPERCQSFLNYSCPVYKEILGFS